MVNGTRMQSLRKAAGLNQADLAEMVGASRSTIGNWERGDRTPTRAEVLAISDALGCSFDQLWVDEVVDEGSFPTLKNQGDILRVAATLVAAGAEIDVLKGTLSMRLPLPKGCSDLRRSLEMVEDVSQLYAITKAANNEAANSLLEKILDRETPALDKMEL